MNLEKERQLEENLINKLKGLGYQYIELKNEKDLKDNLKRQLEEFNQTKISEEEFERIYHWLIKGNIFECSKKIREDSFSLERDSEKNVIHFFDQNNHQKNIFQVSNQIRTKENNNHRYDVTLLINGFPMVQIELKKRDKELSRAFNQVQNYRKNAFTDLFKFIQIFIISNGSETRYFSTSKKTNENSNFKFAFHWTDQNNQKINELIKEDERIKNFTSVFLDRVHLNKMLGEYMVFEASEEEIKVLRPYQFHAIEKIIEHLKNSKDNGYIFHTTGSGKTLTSFKTAKLVRKQIKDIDKVFFVVDRIDLNNQTTREFKKFGDDDEVLDIKNTKSLINVIKKKYNKKIIVTTIQKFKRAIDQLNNQKITLEKDTFWRKQKILLIFDECHRSTFGEQIKSIQKYFKNYRMIGFTGTPIFEENSENIYKTTAEIFDQKLHSYTIRNAILDNSVLPFNVQYFKSFSKKDQKIIDDQDYEVDQNTTLDKKELLEHNSRIGPIVQEIIAKHRQLSKNRLFNALLVVQSVDFLIKYYKEFKKQLNSTTEENPLKIGAIFSKQSEDYTNMDRENDYNEELKTIARDFYNYYHYQHNFSDDWFNHYRIKVIENIKTEKQKDRLDIVIVVGMLTTGFDSKRLNTIYLDRKPKYHSLLQIFSRTNRVYTENKQAGNIICFRPIKKNVDEAITLFSDKIEKDDKIIKPSYQRELNKFNQIISKIKNDYQTIDDILKNDSEIEKNAFVQEFRNAIENMNLLETYLEFDFFDLNISKQDYKEYENCYRSIYKLNKTSEKVSGLDLIDFKIELLEKDYIDASYIENLLNKINQKYQKEIKENFSKEKLVKNYRDSLLNFVEIIKESNRFIQNLTDLIEKFISEELNKEYDSNNLITYDKLKSFLKKYEEEELEKIIIKHNLKRENIEDLIEEYDVLGEINHADFKKISYDKLKPKERKILHDKIEDFIIERDNILNSF